MARWNVTIKPLAAGRPDARPAAPGKAQTNLFEFTKTGSIYLQQFTDALGRRWTNWTSDKIAATVWPGTSAIILQCHIDGLETPDYTRADFPGLAWVAESNFVKTTMYNGKKCLVFSSSTVVTDSPNPSAGSKQHGPDEQPAANSPSQTTRQVIQTAVIDDDTRLPIYAQDAKGTYTFEYLRPPDAMLQIPDEVEKEIKQQAKVSADIVRAVPRAF